MAKSNTPGLTPGNGKRREPEGKVRGVDNAERRHAKKARTHEHAASAGTGRQAKSKAGGGSGGAGGGLAAAQKKIWAPNVRAGKRDVGVKVDVREYQTALPHVELAR
jgi:hypothetical protein